MPTALAISPHLDDIAFSCGATLAKLSAQGWRTVLLTTFTASVKNPTGFALACQTDKGLAPEVDYMAMRRAEDKEAARILGASEVEHWSFLEAPHRGYGSAPELFGALREDDAVWSEMVKPLWGLLYGESPDIVFLPQGIGGHVDHRQVIRAFLETQWPGTVRWYRDTPYIIRNPSALRDAAVPSTGREVVEVFPEDVLTKKIAASAAYVTQIGFQFGGVEGVQEKLAALAVQESGGAGYGERFWETGTAA